ncbi:MAG TPA: hypothetical protein VHO70_24520 [Chitinispirillaceae bacterium]|nr:hypothetical protein [Chitinispirillaceae bacterium]
MHKYLFYIWLVPFFIPLVGFLLSKIPFLKKTRNVIDVVLFFGAFIMDLTNYSLKPEIVSISFGFLLMMIVFKISWSALKMKIKVFRYTVFAAGFVIFFAKYGAWMINSAEIVQSWYVPVAVVNHSRADHVFEIRDYRMARKGRIHRDIKLVGSKKKSMFLKKMDLFAVPDAYINTPFKYGWYLDQTGMVVRLVGDNDTLWMLKEVH